METTTKGHRKKWKQRSCGYCQSCTNFSLYPYARFTLLVLLALCTALVFGALHLLSNSRLNSCSDLQLSDQELYELHISKHANLRITVLSERDGAPGLQSRHAPRLREITIVTQTSIDRLEHLEELASSWGGALCVAVHVPTRAHIVPIHQKMMALHDRIEAQRHCRMHLQIVMEEGYKSDIEAVMASYPVNALRNVALGMATTDLVFILDIDFVPSPGLHEKLTANESAYSELIRMTRNERQLLVVPVFQAQPATWKRRCTVTSIQDNKMPETMQELRERWREGSVESFRPCYPMAHDVTSYSHFLHPLTTEPYPVLYRELYEPYVIAARAIVPHFDERFRGYGKNKVSHAYKCAAVGFTYVVLPQVYLWEIPHPRSKFRLQFMTEREECPRAIMNVVYQVFKTELRNEIRRSHASSNLTLDR